MLPHLAHNAQDDGDTEGERRIDGQKVFCVLEGNGLPCSVFLKAQDGVRRGSAAKRDGGFRVERKADDGKKLCAIEQATMPYDGLVFGLHGHL